MQAVRSRFRALRLAALLSVAVLMALPPLSNSMATTAFAADSAMGQREVEEGLTCQCGCGLTVATCNHLECSFAIPVRKDIAESLARGEKGENILERYRKEYGEKVLSSPIAEGFNLLAWIGPYFAIVVAGLVMYSVLRRRAGGAGTGSGLAATPPSAPAGSGDPRVARLREEVEELER